MSEEKKSPDSKEPWTAPIVGLIEKWCAPTLEKKKTEAEEIAEKRYLERAKRQNLREQENAQSVFEQAGEMLPPDMSVENIEKMDNDWVAFFVQHCKIVSDKEMQSLWAKIMAGEAANPGSFSKQTILTANAMNKADAELFTKFCQFVWIFLESDKNDASGYETRFVPIIIEHNHPIYSKAGINYDALVHLQSLGLISQEIVATDLGVCWGFESPTPICKYGSKEVYFYNIPVSDANLYNVVTGNVLLTRAGVELYPISGAKENGSQENEEYFNYVLDCWQKLGHNPSYTLPPIATVPIK